MSIGWFLLGLPCRVLPKSFICPLIQGLKVSMSTRTRIDGPWDRKSWNIFLPSQKVMLLERKCLHSPIGLVNWFSLGSRGLIHDQGSTRLKVIRRFYKWWTIVGSRTRPRNPWDTKDKGLAPTSLAPHFLIQMKRISSWVDLAPCLSDLEIMPNLRCFQKKGMVDCK